MDIDLSNISLNSKKKEHKDDILSLRRKIPVQNLLPRLLNRELHSGITRNKFNHQNPHIFNSRIFYTNIVPNFTIPAIEKPACFLRKFSPNGAHFIAFTADQMSIIIYEFRGSQVANHRFAGMKNDCIKLPAANEEMQKKIEDIQKNIFHDYFRLRHQTLVAQNGEILNREFSLFSEKSNFVVIGSSQVIPEDLYPTHNQIYKNNESLTPSGKNPLEDITIHVIDLKTGKLCDSNTFKYDKIILSHNQGVFLYKDILALLSLQHQTIHLFQMTNEGCLIPMHSIGQFCNDDDQLFLQSSLPNYKSNNLNKTFYDNAQLTPNSSSSNNFGFTANSSITQNNREINTDVNYANSINLFNGLKHKLLIHLWKTAQATSTGSVKQFFLFFEDYVNLRMCRMQLLDENHILIKYGSEEVASLRITDTNNQLSLFAVYDIAGSEFIGVFENGSSELLNLVEKYIDCFKNGEFLTNIYSRHFHERFKYHITHVRQGVQSETIRRMLSLLPISAQSYSSSPYLDLNLYSFDDKYISPIERPKVCGDHPIRFYARDSGLLKFKIYTGLSSSKIAPARRLAAFTFHPNEPFAISIQRINSDYVVNLHVRNDT